LKAAAEFFRTNVHVGAYLHQKLLSQGS
jgi:hypothetical protein